MGKRTRKPAKAVPAPTAPPELTEAYLKRVADHIRGCGLFLREPAATLEPFSSATGEPIPFTHALKAGDVVSAPILMTASFGPALCTRAQVIANEETEKNPDHPPLRVVGTQVDYAIVPDPNLGIWRAAIKGIDL